MEFPRILTNNIDKPDSHRIDVYIKAGGYKSLEKALKGMSRDEVREEVKKANIRGRGGAGFPAGVKWGFIPKDSDKPTYLCCNADEGEPGTFKDRLIMEKDPHLLLEGIALCCYAVDSHLAYIYIRGEFCQQASILEEAIEEARAKNFIGQKILGTDFDLDVIVFRGAGAYVCGEETALIESIEGKAGQPRLKPPFPAIIGLFQGPTVINNVETLSAIPWIIENGGDKYAAIGTEKSTGTKLFSVSGHVNNPGVYEIPMGYPFDKFLAEDLGGMKDGKQLKAVIPGGSSVPVMRVEEMENVNLDYESIADAGSMLGSGGMIIINEETCMVNALRILARFYAHESCGQCTPCREGTGWIAQILERIVGGDGKEGDLKDLGELADGMMGQTVCPLSDAAAMPVKSFLEKYRDEFEYFIKNKRSMVTG